MGSTWAVKTKLKWYVLHFAEDLQNSNRAERQAQLFFASCVDQIETGEGENDRKTLTEAVEASSCPGYRENQ